MNTDTNLPAPLFSKEVNSTSWRTAVALSLLLHLTLVCTITVLVKKGDGGREIEYIAVDLIRPSNGGKQSIPHLQHVQEVRPEEKPVPQRAADRTPAPDVMGLVQKVPESSPDALSPLPNAPLPYDDMSGSSPEGNSYQPFHAVSRVPLFKVQKKPLYPPSERAAGVETRVIVEIFISEHGTVDNVKVVKSGGPRFDEAVIAAVKGSSFEPGYMNGRPVGVRVQVPYFFKLK